MAPWREEEMAIFLRLEWGSVVCFVELARNSNSGFGMGNSGDREASLEMIGCKRAGETPLASRDKPALRNGSWIVSARGVWDRIAGEGAIPLLEFLSASITQR